jgi:transcriptional regulator with XRE-family HTH domain
LSKIKFLIIYIIHNMNIMRNTMPSTTPLLTDTSAQLLQALGEQIRMQRKSLGVSAKTTAEAAGLSRVTLHRIEKGAPAVTMGAYLHVMGALGLALAAQPLLAAPQGQQAVQAQRKGWLPARIALADYPQLRQLAWQVHDTDTLSPTEALGMYERNARHIDTAALGPAERDLIDALRVALAGDNGFKAACATGRD